MKAEAFLLIPTERQLEKSCGMLLLYMTSAEKWFHGQKGKSLTLSTMAEWLVGEDGTCRGG